MKLFLEINSIDEIKDLGDLQIIDGIGLNTSYFIKNNINIKNTLDELSSTVDLPIFLDIFSNDYNKNTKYMEKLKKIYKNICFRLPFSVSNLKLCKDLSSNGFTIEISYCTSVNHAILAYKADASFISPFLSLVDDFSYSSLDLLKNISTMYRNYPECQTEIKASGIKNTKEISDIFNLGIESCSISFKILNYMLSNIIGENIIKKNINEYKFIEI